MISPGGLSLVHLGLGSDLWVFRTLESLLLVMTPSFNFNFLDSCFTVGVGWFPPVGNDPYPFLSTRYSLGTSVSPRTLSSSVVTGDGPVMGQ
jgi:hypothetical protein